MMNYYIIAGPVNYGDVPFSDAKLLLVPVYAIFGLIFALFITFFVLFLAKIMNEKLVFWTVYKYVYGTILLLLTLLLIFS